MNFQQFAHYYLKNHSFNILPLKNKVPACSDWVKWQTVIMTDEDISALKWKGINGIGAICGIKNLRCLDFDHVEDFTIVKQFIRKLGLPAAYPWTVKSGSGKGYHIWFYCHDDSYIFKILGGEKSYYVLKPLPLIQGKDGMGLKPSDASRHDEPLPASPLAKGRISAACEHIELRWKKCQTVLPPSSHPSGKKYKFEFYTSVPTTPPAHVPMGRLVDTLSAYCILDKEAVNSAGQTRQTPVSTANPASSLSSISEFLAGRISGYDDWLRVGFALASYGEEGRVHFIRISTNNPEYNDTLDALNLKFDGLLKDYSGKVTAGTLYEIAKRYGYVRPADNFWNVNGSKAKIITNIMIEFLEKEGFAKMNINKDFIFIRDNANVISEVTTVDIKDYLIDHIKSSGETSCAHILEQFMNNANSLCSTAILECLHTVNPMFMMDSKREVCFYYKNCFMQVSSDSIKVKEYKELNCKIWEKQKTEHDFYPVEQKSVFQTLIENICRMDKGRINALRSAIGYLLATYKDPSCSKAIIFTDEKLSDNAHGRSGKGLVAKAIGHMKNALNVDGKNFSFDKSFMFQSVDPDTQLIIFDDVKKKFSFEKLFSILTEGMTIEKKNRNEYRLPYARSPKILITTNHTIEGSDDSSLDRQFVVEFSDHYNARYKPTDEFGHTFFEEWDETQWSTFYYYMAECCKYYLKNGLVTYNYVNLAKKKLIDSTSQEFEEFIRSIPLNKEYEKKELIDQFKKEYEDYNQIKQNTLTKWIKLYCDLYGLELTERKSGHERFIKFIPKTT